MRLSTVQQQTTRSLQHWAQRWVRPDFADFVLSRVNPLWRLDRPAARVEAIHPLAPGLVALQLLPNGHFRDGEAGQFVLVTVQIDGVNHQRAYSLVSAPGERPLRLGVRVQGRVSRHLATKVSVGDVLELSQPQGELVLTAGDQAPVLLMGAGSGLSPLMALAAAAVRQGRRVFVLQFGRQLIHAAQLQALEQTSGGRLGWHWVDSAQQRFEPTLLQMLPWDWQQAQAYVCAPVGLLQAVQQCWAEAGQSERLHTEQFVLPPLAQGSEPQPVQLQRQHREVVVQGTLLTGLEQAGLSPASGCRMGICNSCTCVKQSGATRNVLTGEINTEPQVAIKLCISEPVGPVTLDF